MTFSSNKLKSSHCIRVGRKFPGSSDRGMLEEVGGSPSEEGHELHQSQGQVPHCLWHQRTTPFCHPFRPPAVLSACDSFQTTRWSHTGTGCLFGSIPSSLGYRKIMDFYKSCNTTSSTRQVRVQASSLETPIKTQVK